MKRGARSHSSYDIDTVPPFLFLADAAGGGARLSSAVFSLGIA